MPARRKERPPQEDPLTTLRSMLAVQLAKVEMIRQPSSGKAEELGELPVVPELSEQAMEVIVSDPRLMHAFQRLMDMAEKPGGRFNPSLTRLVVVLGKHAEWRHRHGALGPVNRQMRRQLAEARAAEQAQRRG